MDTLGLLFNADNSNGDFNDLSINNVNSNQSYVIDRGVDLNEIVEVLRKFLLNQTN